MPDTTNPSRREFLKTAVVWSIASVPAAAIASSTPTDDVVTIVNDAAILAIREAAQAWKPSGSDHSVKRIHVEYSPKGTVLYPNILLNVDLNVEGRELAMRTALSASVAAEPKLHSLVGDLLKDAYEWAITHKPKDLFPEG